MQESLHLNGSNGSLQIDIPAHPAATAIWCRCYVRIGSPQFIGAEDLHYLKRRLTAWLSTPQSTGWVLTLSETHCSVCSEQHSLNCYDRDGALLCRLHVPDPHKTVWKTHLERLTSQKS